MAMQQIRRYRMEIDLGRAVLPKPLLPDGYVWRKWDPELLERHALVKWESFRSDFDSRVFACLGELDSCRRLMCEITRQRNFVPNSTWMIAFHPHDDWPAADCATIQGLKRSWRHGAIQNVGVVPDHRGQGLGRALVLQSLLGFRRARLKRVLLEVTAGNRIAVDLYRSIGFRITRSMFRPAQVPEPVKLQEMPGTSSDALHSEFTPDECELR